MEQLNAALRQPGWLLVDPGLDLPVERRNALVVEGEETAEEGVQQYTHRPDQQRLKYQRRLTNNWPALQSFHHFKGSAA